MSQSVRFPSLVVACGLAVGLAIVSAVAADGTASRASSQPHDVYDNFGFPLTSDIDGDSTSTSHELRLASNAAGPWKWVAGVYAFDETIHRQSAYNTYITAPFGSFVVNVPFHSTIKNQSQAAFGQLTYSLLSDLRLTAGLRQTHDKKTGVDTLGGTPDGSGAYTAAVEFDNTS
ncbi:MAG TPA: TonB-dependent receptor, partial [Accumulibacter sp.]|uniref:TonB-dependent receptor n=1 Tax=Accumulibacter sp. TaxID=2053492 RepID=UPI002CF9F2A0